jgi:quercetin dioxygenase-like cupin family protein
MYYTIKQSNSNSRRKIKKRKEMKKNMEEIFDALHAASNVSKLIMENDRVRVLDVRFKPGEKAAMHMHPDHMMYIFNDGKFKLTSSQGETQELDLKAGQAIWMDAVSHTAENIGKTNVHLLVVELKE